MLSRTYEHVLEACAPLGISEKGGFKSAFESIECRAICENKKDEKEAESHPGSVVYCPRLINRRALTRRVESMKISRHERRKKIRSRDHGREIVR